MKAKPCPTPSFESGKSGFTLIEMLVVIAIIALLTSILVPTVSRTLDRARRTQSTSNLRQIGQAFHLYVSEPSNRNQEFPATVASDGGPHGTPWFFKIAPYLQREAGNAGDLDRVFRCPVWARIYQRSAQSDWNQLGYGKNFKLFGSPTQPGWNEQTLSTRHRLSEITNPSSTVLVADERTWNWHVHSGNIDSLFENGRYFDKSLGRQRGYRHRIGANYLFVDGRVSFMRPEQVREVLPR